MHKNPKSDKLEQISKITSHLIIELDKLISYEENFMKYKKNDIERERQFNQILNLYRIKKNIIKQINKILIADPLPLPSNFPTTLMYKYNLYEIYVQQVNKFMKYYNVTPEDYNYIKDLQNAIITLHKKEIKEQKQHGKTTQRKS